MTPRWPSPEWICLRSLTSSSRSRLREGIHVLSQALMETEVRRTHWTRTGTSARPSGRATAIALACGPGTRESARLSWRSPKVRPGTYFPSSPPAAVVLELMLPIISGVLVRQELAANTATRKIPVVVVTGAPADHARLNVACVLKKPVGPDSLVKVVRKCLASAA